MNETGRSPYISAEAVPPEGDIVERVARAICSAAPGTGNVDEHFTQGFPLTTKMWTEMARAAIEAMREPTEEMVEASNREWDGRMSHRSSGAWQTMIDAALKVQP